MSSIYGIGLTGITAAQAALTSASNNIANVNTPGYHRTEPLVGQRSSSNGRGGGVEVTGTHRFYQEYLENQLRNSDSKSSELEKHYSQIQQIDKLLGDDEAGLAPLMEDFFAGIEAISSDPTDSAAREAFLGNAKSLTAQFNAFADYMRDMEKSADSQLGGAIDEVNALTSQISKLNDEIQLTQARSGEAPTKLLDERDQQVNELSKLLDVDVSVQDGTNYHITAGGQVLVDANGAHRLSLETDPLDNSKQALYFERGTGQKVQVDISRIESGEIAGLVKFKHESLEPAAQRLDQLAHALHTKFNEVHESGYQLDGHTQGDAFFSYSIDPDNLTVKSNVSGNGELQAAYTTDSDGNIEVDKHTAANYKVKVIDANGPQYQVTNTQTGRKETFTSDNDLEDYFEDRGIEINFANAPDDGDEFLIKPLDNAASSLSVNIDDQSQIAAGQEVGSSGASEPGDNRNALALADLQNEKVVEGNSNFNDTYARLVSDIGNKTHTLEVTRDSQETITEDLQQAQQAVSGVNLDEERVNIMNFVQMYQANAMTIQSADTIFASLLGIFR